MSESNYFSDITKRIETGEYFNDAQEWFLYTIIYTAVERTYLILFTAISLALMFYSTAVILGFRPLAKEVPVAISLTDLSREYSRLVPLISKDFRVAQKQDPDTEVQIYFLKKYITARETYDGSRNFEILNKNIRYIREFSIDPISEAFEKAIDIRNPSSPKIRFRQHTLRTVQIENNQFIVQKVESPRRHFTLEQQPLYTYTASAAFTTQETGPSGSVVEKWNAKIDFLYSPVSYNKEKGQFYTSEFRVLSYQVAKIE